LHENLHVLINNLFSVFIFANILASPHIIFVDLHFVEILKLPNPVLLPITVLRVSFLDQNYRGELPARVSFEIFKLYHSEAF